MKPYADEIDLGPLPAHAAAARDALADIVERLTRGDPPESCGRLVVQIGKMMERKQ